MKVKKFFRYCDVMMMRSPSFIESVKNGWFSFLGMPHLKKWKVWQDYEKMGFYIYGEKL